MKNNELNNTKKYLSRIDLENKSQVIKLLSSIFPILIEDKKNLLIEAIQRWFLNWNDLDELWKYLEEVYQIEIQEKELYYGQFNRIVWNPEEISENVELEMKKFLNLMKMIF